MLSTVLLRLSQIIEIVTRKLAIILPSYVNKLFQFFQQGLTASIVEVDCWVCSSIFEDKDNIGPAMVWSTPLETFQVEHIKTQVILLSLSLHIIHCKKYWYILDNYTPGKQEENK